MAYEIRRKQTGTAYARSGNAHNPTPRYRYDLYLDGKLIDSSLRRGDLEKHYKLKEEK